MQIDLSLRRVFDACFSLVVLLLLAPFLILIALVIRLDSPGSPLYLGKRVGKNGVLFPMWKFRTMTAGADRMGGGITGKRDSRITKVGHFLRKTKLDELPQFVNSLIGDMSIVGPRAEVPSIVERYSPQQREILAYKPGVTGVGALHYTTTQMSQLPGDCPADAYYVANLLPAKLQIELEYECSRTIPKDLCVIFSTIHLILCSMLVWPQRGRGEG